MVSDESTTEVLEIEQTRTDGDEQIDENNDNETLWIRQHRSRPGRSEFNQRSGRSGYRGRYPNNSRDRRCHNYGSDKHFVRYCDKPLKQNQSQFTGVVQDAVASKSNSKDESFEVFAGWNETIERSSLNLNITV